MKPLGTRHTQKVVHHLAQQGIEMTPEEVVEQRKLAYATIRKKMRALGYEVPDGDVELLLWMKELMKHGRE